MLFQPLCCLGTWGNSSPQKNVLSRGARAVVELVPWGLVGRGAVVDVVLFSTPSLRAWEKDRSLSLTDEGGAIIGSIFNLSLIRRHAKLKGPGVIPQMLAY